MTSRRPYWCSKTKNRNGGHIQLQNLISQKKFICCSKVALGGKSCSKLLAAQEVTQNSKSCPKENLYRPSARSGLRNVNLNGTRLCKYRL